MGAIIVRSRHNISSRPSKPSSAGRCAAASLVRVCRLLRGLFKTQCKTTLCSSAAQLLLSHSSNLEGARRPTDWARQRERTSSFAVAVGGYNKMHTRQTREWAAGAAAVAAAAAAAAAG